MIANNFPLLIMIYFPVLYREVLLSFPVWRGNRHAFFEKCSAIKEYCSFCRGSTVCGKEPWSQN